MPFGLKKCMCNVPEIGYKIFSNLISITVKAYVDDTVVESKVATNYLTYLSKLFSLLKRFNMKFNPKKKCFRGIFREIPRVHGNAERNKRKSRKVTSPIKCTTTKEPQGDSRFD